MALNFLKPYHTNLSNLIRLGRKSDGGFVIDRRIINKTKAVITCGLETEWSFEEDFQKKIKIVKLLLSITQLIKTFGSKGLRKTLYHSYY